VNTTQQTAAPSAVRTVTEYAIRYSEIGCIPGDRRLRLRFKYRLCSRTTAVMRRQEIRAYQESSPLCPKVDAVIVTRTLTYSAWSTQTAQAAQAASPDPDAAYKATIEADLPGGAA
jgi:hypothetical protein